MKRVDSALEEIRSESFAVAVDAHTAGEPIRVILKGCNEKLMEQSSMVERQQWMKNEEDVLRTRTMREPRGHAAMFGAIVMDPVEPEADVGVLFPYPAGYADMCGHGSIGVATVLLELDLLEAQEGKNEITLDTPAGLVSTVAHYEGGGVDRVDLFGTPSYFVETLEVELEEGERVEVALSFGGNFFGIVRAEELGLTVNPGSLDELNSYAHEIMKKINRRKDITLRHPETGNLPLERIRFVEGEGASKNVVIHEGSVIDRSPCGTGTCSQLAWEHEKGELEPGEDKLYRSIIGTEFRGRLAEEQMVDGRRTIIPRVTGSSYITGLNYFLASDSDPLLDGFSINHA